MILGPRQGIEGLPRGSEQPDGSDEGEAPRPPVLELFDNQGGP